MLVFYEEAGIRGYAAYIVRALLSKHRIDYDTVEKTTHGLHSKKLSKVGPVGLILTTTKVRLYSENETRLMSITVSDSPEQTAAVFKAVAKQGQHGDQNVDLANWHALQSWLEAGERRVQIPYAELLADLMPSDHVRLRRDFGAVLQ